jgi:predicted TIM-barrel fold metal-dependent hydrolase
MTAAPLLLDDIAVIDNHCHAVESDQQTDTVRWRRFFTESPDADVQARDVAHTALYRRLTRRMAQFYDVPNDEALVLAARNSRSTPALVQSLFRDANIGGVVIDTGYPAPESVLAVNTFVASSGSEYRALLRLEVMFEQMIAVHAAYDDLVAAVDEKLADLRSQGYCGLKCIAGYRTGLSIQRWPARDVQSAFAAARAQVDATGSVRLGHKPLLDSLLHLAFAAAAAQELPVQFHVGYGDPDADLRSAAPLELRSVLEERSYRGMPVVLLHGCWPYFREGAYLAAVYGNVHLDLSYAIPFLSVAEMTSMSRAALGAAPFTKLMYSSDGARVPELHWLGAHDGRRVLGRVLDELVQDGDLDRDEAMSAARRILRGNAARLYGFAGEDSDL